jgi:hypothetical protein
MLKPDAAWARSIFSLIFFVEPGKSRGGESAAERFGSHYYVKKLKNPKHFSNDMPPYTRATAISSFLTSTA